MKISKNLNRRTFLKTTAAAATAAPFILPSRIWAAETKPNDRLTLGFVGMGTQNRGLLGGFLTFKEPRSSRFVMSIPRAAKAPREQSRSSTPTETRLTTKAARPTATSAN